MSNSEVEISTANDESLRFRAELAAAFNASPLNPADKLFNLGLYVRSSVLVKFLVLSDLYRRFKSVPGVLIEFGTWWGQNLILLENLRAIYEPFNKQRVIIGFDTFDGYPDASGMAPASVERHAGYQTGKDYRADLARLLEIHEGNNAFGHIRGNHKLIAGDVVDTAPRYFAEHPETLVAFAFFDMGPYEPTIAALRSIKPHLLPGSILVFDELTWSAAPGEAIAFKQVFAGTPYAIEKCELYPSKAIVTIK